jgi:hypothetical protein
MPANESYVSASTSRPGRLAFCVAAFAVGIGLVDCWLQFGPRFESSPLNVIMTREAGLDKYSLTLQKPAEIEALVMRTLRFTERILLGRARTGW